MVTVVMALAGTVLSIIVLHFCRTIFSHEVMVRVIVGGDSSRGDVDALRGSDE